MAGRQWVDTSATTALLVWVLLSTAASAMAQYPCCSGSVPPLLNRFTTSIQNNQPQSAMDSSRGVMWIIPDQTPRIAALNEATGNVTYVPLTLNNLLGFPSEIAVDEGANRVYVSDGSAWRLWVVDAASQQVVNVIDLPGTLPSSPIGGVGTKTTAVFVNPRTGLVYAVTAGPEGTDLVVLDTTASFTVIRNVLLGPTDPCNEFQVNTTTNLIYTNCLTPATTTPGVVIDVIDGDPSRQTFNQVIDSLRSDVTENNSDPFFAVDRSRNLLLVLEEANAFVWSLEIVDIDPSHPTYNQATTSVPVPAAAVSPLMDSSDVYGFLAYDPVTRRAYVALNDTNGDGYWTLTVFDTVANSVVSAGQLPFSTYAGIEGGIVVDPVTNRVLVATALQGNPWNPVFETLVLDGSVTTSASTAIGAAPVTVSAPQVTIAFPSVVTAGTTTVHSVDPTQLNLDVPGEFALQGTSALEISTTATVTTPITLCFNASYVIDPAVFATLRVLHGENGVWIDRTVSNDFASGIVCASVMSFSPFAIARRAGILDATPPTITIAAPLAMTYMLHASVVSSYSCSDVGSGIGVCIGSTPVGSAIDTSTVGTRSFTVTAVDNAGNPATQTIHYAVGYGVSVVYDESKVHKSGSTVPLKVQLIDALGINVSSAAVAVTAVSLDLISSQTSGVLDDSGNANVDNSFRYDAASAAYIYNLSTTGLSTGVWELHFVATGDPTPHTIQFQVK
jgi:hypothetical protein